MNLGNKKINIRKNAKLPVLHLVADIKSGEYYAFRDDGPNKQEVHRKVTEEAEENFNREVEKSRKNKIMKKFNISKKEVGNIEAITYKTLEDFDRNYNTDYCEKYVNIMTMEIKKDNNKRKNFLTNRGYCEEIRREKLKKAGIVIDYNLPVMEGLVKNKHKMNMIDRLKFIKYAIKSKSNGANINFKIHDDKNDNLEENTRKKTFFKSDKVKDKRKQNDKKAIKGKALKGLYRATLLSLGILGGALGFKKGLEDGANRYMQIESVMDTNNSKDNSLDNERTENKDSNKIKNSTDKVKDNSTNIKNGTDKVKNNINNIKDGKDRINSIEDGNTEVKDNTKLVSQKSDISESDRQKKEFENRIVVKGITPCIIKDDENINSEETKKRDFSQIKIGSRVTINNGNFFETATGEGKSGSFEKQDKGPRVLSLINIVTKNGNNILIQNGDDRNLYELKNRYPNAKFSYHFTDVHGNAYGWVTKDSFASNLKRDKEQVKPKKEKQQIVQKVAEKSQGKKEQKPKEKKLKYGEMDEDGWTLERY